MSASNSPQYLVKAVFNDKLKIFQLGAPTMAALWGKIQNAFDIPNESKLQGQYVDKDNESILLDTDEELMLAFAICDVPLRINVKSRSTNAESAEPVAVPVQRNDAVTKQSSDVYDEDGFVSATIVVEPDFDVSSDDDDSSSSDENEPESGPWTHTDPDMVSCAERTLAEVGVVVQARNLQAFMQLLQVPMDRLSKVGIVTPGTTDQKRAQGLKKMTKSLAKSDRRQAALMAKREKVEAKLVAKQAKADSKSSRRKDSSGASSSTAAASTDNQYDAFGDWWVVEQALPAETPAFGSGNKGGVRPGGCSGGRMDHLQRKLLWPLFWRRVLLEHDVDIDAGTIRQLCVLLRIRKGKLFRRGLASRKDFVTFASSQDIPACLGRQPSQVAKEATPQPQVVHPNVACDGCGEMPLGGNRYKMLNRNYDLCESDFAKLTPHEKSYFVVVDPPEERMPECGFGKGKGKGKGFGWKGKGGKGKGHRHHHGHGHGWKGKGKGRGGGMRWGENRREQQHESVSHTGVAIGMETDHVGAAEDVNIMNNVGIMEHVDGDFSHPDCGQEDFHTVEHVGLMEHAEGDFSHADLGQPDEGDFWHDHHHHHHHHGHHGWKGKGKGMLWHMKGKGKGKGKRDFHQQDHHEHDMWMMEKGKGKKGMHHHHGWQKGKGRGGGWGCGGNDSAAGLDSDDNAGDRCGWRRRGGGRGGGGMRAWGEESGEGGKCLARFVSHVTVPDGQLVQPGESFLKIWSVRNDGNQPWPTGCELVTVGGGGGKGKGRRRDDDRGAAENADGSSTALVRGAAFHVPHSAVAPGKEVSIALDFRAPHEPGLYQVFFRLRDAVHGKKFGQRLWFSIMVKEKVTSLDGINPVQPIGSGSRKLNDSNDHTSFGF